MRVGVAGRGRGLLRPGGGVGHGGLVAVAGCPGPVALPLSQTGWWRGRTGGVTAVAANRAALEWRICEARVAREVGRRKEAGSYGTSRVAGSM